MATALLVSIERFLVELSARGYSQRTIEAYGTNLRVLEEFLERRGVDDIQAVSGHLLVEFQTEMMLKERSDGQRLAAETQAHRIIDARQFFRYLVRKGHLLVDPSTSLVVPRCVRRPPDRVLDVAAVRKLLLAPDVGTDLGLRDRAIVELLYSTGVRVSELLGLDVGDIDLVEGELVVRRGKGGKSRRLPMGGAAVLWLGRYVGEARMRLLVRSGERALFISYRGRRLHKVNVEKALKGYGRAVGIGIPVTPHVLRHTFATHMLRGRASLRHVQEMLGHALLTTTQIYTKVDISDLKEVHRRCHPRGRG